MGVIYKLKPEIKSFILEIKKAKPILSCRGLVVLIADKFKINISKSSVNTLIKEAGLSLSVGRRRKRRRRKVAGLLPVVTEPQVKALVELPPEGGKDLSLAGQIETPLPPPAQVQAEPPLPAPVPAIPEEKPTTTPVEETGEIVAGAPTLPEITAPVTPPPIETPAAAVTPPPTSPEVITPSPPQMEIPTEAEGLGTIILKAADYLLNGSHYIAEAIQNRLRSPKPDLLAKTEYLLYLPLFDAPLNKPLESDCGLWSLLNQRFASREIVSYLDEIQEIRVLSSDIFRIISTIFQEVRGIRVSLSAGSSFYLDGQLHTIWSAPQIPYNFTTTFPNITSYIHKYFQDHAPLVLFMAPGFDAPTRELFDFMSSLEATEKSMVRLTLFGNKFEELDEVNLEQNKKRRFILGLWPWQFGQFRRVKTIGEFRKFSFAPLNRDFYLAEGQIELSQPNSSHKVTLKACFLKTNLEDKIRLSLLTNLSPEEANLETLAEIYLNHWPNLEEAFQDFSRKIELFTYMANSQRFFSIEELNFMREPSVDTNTLLNLYLQALDLYVRLHFLPSGYEDKDFATTKEQFYRLKASLKKHERYTQVTFQPPAGFAFLKDLEYACHRLNEKEIIFSDGRRLWFSIA